MGLMSVLQGEGRLHLSTRTEDAAPRADPVDGGLGQEVFHPLPTFLPGRLHVNFDRVTGIQSRPERIGGRIRRIIERCGKCDWVFGRGDRRYRPAIH